MALYEHVSIDDDIEFLFLYPTSVGPIQISFVLYELQINNYIIMITFLYYTITLHNN